MRKFSRASEITKLGILGDPEFFGFGKVAEVAAFHKSTRLFITWENGPENPISAGKKSFYHSEKVLFDTVHKILILCQNIWPKIYVPKKYVQLKVQRCKIIFIEVWS